MNTRTLLSFTLATFVIAPFAAHAQDFTPIGDRILSDPNYLPLQGQIYGQSGYTFDRTKGTTFDSTGAVVQTNRNDLNTVGQAVAFGVTDALSLRASLDYGWGSNDRNTVHGMDDASREGFEDPSFGATYRILDQKNHPFILDVFGDWSPDAFASRAASATQDGTVARGGATADFGAAIGRTTKMISLRGAFTDRYIGGQTTFEQATGFDVNTSSYWVPTLSFDAQARFTPRLSLNAGYDYDFQGSPTVFNAATGISYLNRIGNTQDVHVALNYHFVPNRVVGSVGYQHNFFDDRNALFADPADDILQSRSGNVWSATVRYVFR